MNLVLTEPAAHNCLRNGCFESFKKYQETLGSGSCLY